MEQNYPIPDDIRRFILNRIESVPHLEAILLFYRQPKVDWNIKLLAESLFISEKRASAILVDLCESGFIAMDKEEASSYRYQPKSLEKEALIDRLSEVYAKQLIEVTHLIHSKVDKQAQSFGDAFKWRQEEGG